MCNACGFKYLRLGHLRWQRNPGRNYAMTPTNTTHTLADVRVDVGGC